MSVKQLIFLLLVVVVVVVLLATDAIAGMLQPILMHKL